MVCKATFGDPVSKGEYWYTPTQTGKGQTILRMKEVLMVDIQLMKIIEKLSYQRGIKDIYELIEEITRRDQFDEEFDINSNERLIFNNETEVNKGSLRVYITNLIRGCK